MVKKRYFKNGIIQLSTVEIDLLHILKSKYVGKALLYKDIARLLEIKIGNARRIMSKLTILGFFTREGKPRESTFEHSGGMRFHAFTANIEKIKEFFNLLGSSALHMADRMYLSMLSKFSQGDSDKPYPFVGLYNFYPAPNYKEFIMSFCEVTNRNGVRYLSLDAEGQVHFERWKKASNLILFGDNKTTGITQPRLFA